MTIYFKCPECEMPIHAADDMAGESGKCPECQKPITVPHPPDKSAAAT